MNIKQALKLKNKLVTQIKEQYEIAKAHNSIEQGNPRRYSALDAINNAVEFSNSLVELKTKIHLANAPVYGLIFKMSELKNQIKQLKSIPVDEGKVTERYGSTVAVKEAEINIAERDDIIKSIEAEIESIQDELDNHNATTEI